MFSLQSSLLLSSHHVLEAILINLKGCVDYFILFSLLGGTTDFLLELQPWLAITYCSQTLELDTDTEKIIGCFSWKWAKLYGFAFSIPLRNVERILPSEKAGKSWKSWYHCILVCLPWATFCPAVWKYLSSFLVFPDVYMLKQMFVCCTAEGDSYLLG